MKFDKNYDYLNIFNNMRSSFNYHGYLIGRFQSESIDLDTQRRQIEANRSMVNVAWKTKKEYFERKVKCINCIYVLLCINCDKELQGYEQEFQSVLSV